MKRIVILQDKMFIVMNVGRDYMLKDNNRTNDIDYKKIVYVFLGIFSIAFLIEALFLIHLYLNSDEVECNFIFCTFKDTMREEQRTCYENGELVECSYFDNQYNSFAEKGYNTISGVCPSLGSNMTLEDCIEKVKNEQR